MDECWQRPPPFFQPDPQRIAACFLHRDSPVLPTADVAEVFGR